MTNKHSIQLVQVNNSYGNQYFIPYSVGLLQAFCMQFEEIKESFDFSTIVYKQEADLEAQVKRLGKIDIVAQSCYVWNWQFNLRFAELVKKYNPDALVILGGPQVPDKSEGFFDEHPFVDLLCHGEGELVFYEILKQYIGPQDYGIIDGLSFNDKKAGQMICTQRRPQPIKLDTIPSPYIEGVFDDLMKEDVLWQASWETNRGCPYRCTFCVWGAEYFSKLRKFSLEDRLLHEVKWFANNKIVIVFGCDANFGVFKRDIDIAKALVDVKEKVGHPQKFRVCNAKNSNERVFQIAEILNEAKMAKGTSVSVQSMDEGVLETIKRKNIGLDKFKDLMSRFNQSSIVTYTEVILPLPGETFDSFVGGIDTLLHGGQHSQILIYNCTVLANSEMAHPDYVKEHGIGMVKSPVFQAHVDNKPSETIQEIETIAISTKTMPPEDWKKSQRYSWAIQTFHTLGLLQYIAIVMINRYGATYSDFYKFLIEYAETNPTSQVGRELAQIDKSIESLESGKGYGQLVPSYGLDIVWPPEEASYMRILENVDTFYVEVADMVNKFSDANNIKLEGTFFESILSLQKECMVHYSNSGQEAVLMLHYNLDEYISNILSGFPAKLIRYKQPKELVMKKEWIDTDNKKEFARNIVWYGRKGGKFINKFS